MIIRKQHVWIIKLKNLKSIKIKKLVHMEKEEEEEEMQPLTIKPDDHDWEVNAIHQSI